MLKEEIEQALSQEQDSILGWTVDFDCGLGRDYMPSIYGNNIPTGKPGPWKE